VWPRRRQGGMPIAATTAGRPREGRFSLDSRARGYVCGIMNAVRTPVAVAMALALMVGGVVVGAPAAPPLRPQATAAPSPRRGNAITLSMDQAVRLAERRYRARVVRAETRTEGNRTIYVLRMLDGAGRVFSVQVDAASGTIL